MNLLEKCCKTTVGYVVTITVLGLFINILFRIIGWVIGISTPIAGIIAIVLQCTVIFLGPKLLVYFKIKRFVEDKMFEIHELGKCTKNDMRYYKFMHDWIDAKIYGFKQSFKYKTTLGDTIQFKRFDKKGMQHYLWINGIKFEPYLSIENAYLYDLKMSLQEKSYPFDLRNTH